MSLATSRKSETMPTLTSCMAVVALIGILVYDQMWSQREIIRENMIPVKPAVESTETPATENSEEPEREPPRVRLRSRFTLPA